MLKIFLFCYPNSIVAVPKSSCFGEKSPESFLMRLIWIFSNSLENGEPEVESAS